MSPRLGSVATGDDFFDRTTERQRFWRLIENNHINLAGPRRLGKTSLLRTLEKEAAAHGYSTCYVDVAEARSAGQFMALLDKKAPNGPIGTLQNAAGNHMDKLLGRIRHVSGKAAGTEVAVEIQAPAAADWRSVGEHIHRRIGSRKLILMIDEFSVFLDKALADSPDEARELLHWLRAWRQEDCTSPLRFVFSGSIGLTQLLIRHNLTTLLNDVHDFRLEPFALADAIAMVQAIAHRAGHTVDESWAKDLCEKVGWLSPFYVNLLLAASLEAGEERTPAGPLNLADIDAGLHRIQTRGTFSHWFSRLKERLPPTEWQAAALILARAARKPEGVSRRILMNRLQTLEADQENRAVLLDNLLLQLEFEGYLDAETDPVRFLSPLLRAYWSIHHGHYA